MTPIWWLLIFVPGLLSLYFLKLRRQDQRVSSTLLWKRSVEDMHVNAPFQRLRKNWLLLLQLLIVLALITAAWRPRTMGLEGGGRNHILLIDNSASMGAVEKDGTRLDLAKRDALALVSRMSATDRASVVVFSSKTAVVEPLTADKGLLEARIKSIQPSALPTSLDQALIVAHSIAETLPGAEVQVFGDSCYGDLSTLPAEVKRMSVKLTSEATALENVAITEADVRRSFEAKGRTEVFALVENTGKSPAKVTVSLGVDGEIRDARAIDLPPGGSEAVLFDATSITEGIAQISIDTEDALSVDNRAWVRIAPPKTSRVLVVGKPNPWIDLVLKATNGLTFRRMGEAEYVRALVGADREESVRKLEADVLIFDRASPEAFSPPGKEGEKVATLPEPPLPALYFACRPPLPKEAAAEEGKKLPVVIDWDRTHPVNRFIVLADLYVEESVVFKTAGEMRSIVDSDSGSLISTLRYYPPGQRPVPALLVGFDILKTNWPIGHYSFPIFFSNAISWLASGASSADVTRARAGEALTYEPLLRNVDPLSVRFRSPSGKLLAAMREATGAFVLGVAEEAGVYEVEVAEEKKAKLPVGLLSASESRLEPLQKVSFGDFEVKAEASKEKASKDLWKWFALAALLLTLFEWHVYNRRLAG